MPAMAFVYAFDHKHRKPPMQECIRDENVDVLVVKDWRRRF